MTPDVAVIVPGLHPFDPRAPRTSALQQEQSSRCSSYGDRAAAPGCSARRRRRARSRPPPAPSRPASTAARSSPRRRSSSGIDDVSARRLRAAGPAGGGRPGLRRRDGQPRGTGLADGRREAAAGLDVHARVVLQRRRRHAHRPADPVRRRQRPLVRLALRRGHEQRLRRGLVERRPDRGVERQLVRRGRMRRPAAARRRRRRRRPRCGHLPELRRAVLAGARLGALGDQQGGARSSGAATIDGPIYGPNTDYSSFAPVQSLSSTSTEYVVSVDNPRSSRRASPGRDRHPTGAGADQGGRDARRSASSCRPRTRRSRRSRTGGARISVATNDDRMLDSVWENGKLWFAGNAGCLPPGDSLPRLWARRRALDRDRNRRLGRPTSAAPAAASSIRRSVPTQPATSWSSTASRPRPRAAGGGGRADAGRDLHAVRRRRAERRAAHRRPLRRLLRRGARSRRSSVVWVVGETATDGRSAKAGDGGRLRRRHSGGRNAAPAVVLPPPAVRAGRWPGRRERRCCCSTSRWRPGPACASSVTVSSRKARRVHEDDGGADDAMGRLYASRGAPRRRCAGLLASASARLAADGTQSGQSCCERDLRR